MNTTRKWYFSNNLFPEEKYSQRKSYKQTKKNKKTIGTSHDSYTIIIILYVTIRIQISNSNENEFVIQFKLHVFVLKRNFLLNPKENALQKCNSYNMKSAYNIR